MFTSKRVTETAALSKAINLVSSQLIINFEFTAEVILDGLVV
jgi:hypothetical protein